MSRPALALVILVAGACGPKQGPTGGGGGGNSSGSGSGSSSASGSGGGGSSSGSGSGSSSDAPLTRAECEQMIDHVLEIGMAEQRAQKPAEYVPTQEQVTKIREKLAAEQLEPCLAWPRPVWECTVAAVTVSALYACAAEP